MPLYTVVSRNVSSCSLTSHVNLIVLCSVFAVSMYVVNSSFVPVHMMNMSSVNLFQIRICLWPSSVLCLPMNKFAYVGDIFVPIAVPWICR